MFKAFLYGAAFGVTQIVPGISGGTIAVILGFYNRLIESLNHFREDMRRHIKFLAPFLFGIAAGIIAFSSLIQYLITNYSLATMSFFIGMIAGLIPVIYLKLFCCRDELCSSAETEPNIGGKTRTNTVRPYKRIILIILPALMLVLLSNLRTAPVAASPENISVLFMIFIFFSGLIAAAALIMPGISGSLILLLFGVYNIITYSVSSIRFLLLDITNIQLWLDIIKILAPFAVGVLIGLLTMARLIEKLLKNYSATIYAVILGLLLGSVYTLLNEPLTFQSGISALSIAASITTFIFGCVISFLLGRKRM